MSKHTIEDAKRCLQCKTPQCTEGCPIRTPVRDVIRHFLDGKVTDAGKMLFDNNPLSLVCSFVCPQENQCEGHCVMGRRGSPVYISSIEKYISDYYLNAFEPTTSSRDKGNIAIIGAGPAGIAMAFVLAQKDYAVTLFEQNEQIGGILRYGIPEFRLPNRVIDELTEKLVRFGVKIRPNTVIGINLTMDDLFRDGYDAAFIGTGTWRPGKLGVRGESRGHVHFAVEYLKSPTSYHLGEKVVIVGAGNVAMDAARTAFRHGSKEVTIFCRSGQSSISARDFEVQYAKIDGATFEMHKTTKEIVEGGVIFLDTNEEGQPIEGSEQFYDADSVIIAVGQRPRSIIVQSTTGIEIDSRGRLIVDESGQTTRAGVFSGGDVVTGARTVVDAVVAARKVADAIDTYVCQKRAQEAPWADVAH